MILLSVSNQLLTLIMKTKIIFQLNLGKYTFILRRKYCDRAYAKRNRAKINEYQKYRYQNNINGTRDRALERAKRRNKKKK